MDPLKRVALASQYGKQVLQRLRVRPSTAISLDEPHLDSAPLPEVPAAVVPTPEIYEERHFPAWYPNLIVYEEHGQLLLPETSFTPQFRLETAHPTMGVEPELTAVAEISQAIDDVKHPSGLDGLLQQPDILDPRQEQGLDSLLDDPMLGPLGPLF